MSPNPITSGCILMAVLPSLLLATFLVKGRRAREQYLSKAVRERVRAREVVVTTEGTDADRRLNDLLVERYHEQHRLWNYVLPLFCFHAAYLLGLYWVDVGLNCSPLAGASVQTVEMLRLAAIGFVGAALTAIGYLSWRVMRNDVLPRLFVHLSYRLLLVPPLALLVGGISGLALEVKVIQAALAFAVGMFPSYPIRTLRAWFLQKIGQQPATHLLLEEIQGIDQEDYMRLWEEGITDAQHLASVKIEDLVIRTSYPLERVVDWKDQAYLYIYVGNQLAEWRKLHIRGALDVLGLAPSYYEKERYAPTLDALSEKLGTPRAVIDRLVDTIYNDPAVHQLWTYTRNAFPTEVAQPIVSAQRSGDAAEPRPPNSHSTDSGQT
jgi:hypothetical protein